jgi:hypothetical protein
MDHFYVVLPSDSSEAYYPDNTVAHYKTKLPYRISGDYEVALIEFIYPNNMTQIYIPASLSADIYYDNDYITTWRMDEGYYKNVEVLTKYMSESLTTYVNAYRHRFSLQADESLQAVFTYDEKKMKFDYVYTNVPRRSKRARRYDARWEARLAQAAIRNERQRAKTERTRRIRQGAVISSGSSIPTGTTSDQPSTRAPTDTPLSSESTPSEPPVAVPTPPTVSSVDAAPAPSELPSSPKPAIAPTSTYVASTMKLDIQLNNNLMDRFGFDSWTDDTDITRYESAMEFDTHLDSRLMFIYCDVCAHGIVGDITAPLLKVVAPQGQQGRMVNMHYANPQYVPVANRDFDSIEINIKNEFGRAAPFDGGKSVVTLHFRRRNESVLRDTPVGQLV